MKKFLRTILITVIGMAAGVAQPQPEMRIVSEDQHSVIIEFTPQMQCKNIIGTSGGIYTQLSFLGSQTIFDSTGLIDYCRAVPLLLPTSEYSLQVIANDFQISDTIKLPPKPRIKSIKDFGVTEIYDDEKFSYNSIPSENTPVAELVQSGKIDYGCMGILVIHPIKKVDDNKLKIYSRITVRINFKESLASGMLSTCLLSGDLPKKSQLMKNVSSSFSKISAGDYPLSSGDWYKFEVTEPGMYKLDYAYFNNLGISVGDINSIRLFGNGGLAISDNILPTTPDSLIEISRLVIDNDNNGIFNSGDYVIFYGRGVRGWKYNGGNTFEHYINPYTEKNYYFFTINQGIGKTMDSIVSSTEPPAYSPSYFQEKLFVEEESYNLLNSGRKWVGKLFTGTDNTVTYYNSMPGLVSNTQIQYKFNLLRRSAATTDRLIVYENNQASPFMTVAYLPKSTLSDYEEDAYAAETPTYTGLLNSSVISNNASVLKLVVSGNQNSKTWLDWFSIYYQREFKALNDALLFTTRDSTATITVEYNINNFSSNVKAFDVTSHSNVRRIIYNQSDPTIAAFRIQQTSGSVNEIAVVGNNGYKIPNAAVKVETYTPNNLHAYQNPTDFIIISPKEYISEANRLKTHRESQPDPLNTLVVDIQQIYNEFSGGLPDPLAIREFLEYTQNRWINKPQFVLLFGHGHFDYKNISTNQRNWIPPYETPESLVPVDTYASDDKFVIFGSPVSYALAIGRLPARNLKDAAIAVNKIISYETNSFAGAWRNQITFVADDGLTSTTDDGPIYTNDSESLSKLPYTSPSYDKKKIYIVEYPTINSSSGRRKPEANKAIVDAINQGSLITNFIGHGSESLWAHEAIFTQANDIPQLFNSDRLTFIVAATCSYGRYDGPSEISSAEQLVTMEQGGNIANISASRVVYQGKNSLLNQSIYTYLLQKNSEGIYRRLGDAWRLAKIYRISEVNSLKFHLFGDPTVRLLMPKNIVSIDSINAKSALTADTIKIKSLGQVQITGMLKQNSTTPIPSFNGTGTLQIYDSQKKITKVENGRTYTFNHNGSLLYRGLVSIDSGKFTTIVPIPKDVTFGKTARISMYAMTDQKDGNGYTDGSGFTENVMIDGIDTTAKIETEGPRISIYLEDLSFQPGNLVKNNPTLIVRLSDSSGINTSTAGVGHQLSAIIDNPVRTFDISNYYHSDLNTYTSGEVRYSLSNLSDGKYTLSVKAWDIQNNASEAETYFEVHSADDHAIQNTMNYPNPFSRTTTFTFQRNSNELIYVEVKIYTIAGRLIGNIIAQSTESFVRIPWNGKDNDGSEIANGVYFYKIITRSSEGKYTNETIGKLAVMR